MLDFNEPGIFSADFRKVLIYKLSLQFFCWEPSCSMQTDRWTDRRADVNNTLPCKLKTLKNRVRKEIIEVS